MLSAAQLDSRQGLLAIFITGQLEKDGQTTGNVLVSPTYCITCSSQLSRSRRRSQRRLFRTFIPSSPKHRHPVLSHNAIKADNGDEHSGASSIVQIETLNIFWLFLLSAAAGAAHTICVGTT